MVNIFLGKSLRTLPFKDYKWKITTNNKPNKITFWLHCHIYYKTLGSLLSGILYDWFWQWLTWFGLLRFHPREIKHQKSMQVCNGPEIYNLFCKLRLQRLEKLLKLAIPLSSLLLKAFPDFERKYVANDKDFISMSFSCMSFRRQFSLNICPCQGNREHPICSSKINN